MYSQKNIVGVQKTEWHPTEVIKKSYTELLLDGNNGTEIVANKLELVFYFSLSSFLTPRGPSEVFYLIP